MTTVVVPICTCMPNNEEISSKNEPTDSKANRTSSITGYFPIKPIAAATRFVSSLSKQNRTNDLTESDTKESLAKSTKQRILFARNRSTSPDSLSSEKDALNRDEFSTNSSPPKLHTSSTTPSNLNHRSKVSSSSVNTPLPSPDKIDSSLEVIYTELRELVEANCYYFSQQKGDICKRYERLLSQLSHFLALTVPLIRYLMDNFHHFDYSTEIRANGYRTLVVIHAQACLRTLDILRQINSKRVNLLFNLMHASGLFQELESWTKALTALQHIFTLAVKIIDYSEKKVLCIDVNKIPMDTELDYFKIVAVDSEYFFGKTCGFQFAPSMETMLTFLLAGLATYYETYNRSIPFAAARLATAPKYILFPEQRARKCSDIFRDSDYLFCKSFWNLVDHDYIKMGSRYIVPNVTVSKYFQIGPEPIEIGSVIVQPPTSGPGPDEQNERAAGNIGPGSDNLTGSGSAQPKQLVNIKLLSNEVREGMNELPLKKSDFEISSSRISPMSDQLIMHVHGGGFIATSSTTHEVYLKPWAIGLEVPIVSVDYSLAPEYPFPRAIEECFYAYAWILKNPNKLGWTGKTILLIGDSAGGNLVTVVTIKAIEAGLRRPDAVICFYTPFLLGYSMSPSRLMAIMDPLLNTGFLLRCLASYAGIQSDNQPDGSTDTSVDKKNKSDAANSSTVTSDESHSEDIYYKRLTEIIGSRQAYLIRTLRDTTLTNHPHMSPLRASDDILRQFPMTYLIPCTRDPFIDDNVEFAVRLRSLKAPHQLIVVDEWPHGFLDLSFVSNAIAEHNLEMLTMLQNIIQDRNW